LTGAVGEPVGLGRAPFPLPLVSVGIGPTSPSAFGGELHAVIDHTGNPSPTTQNETHRRMRIHAGEARAVPLREKAFPQASGANARVCWLTATPRRGQQRIQTRASFTEKFKGFLRVGARVSHACDDFRSASPETLARRRSRLRASELHMYMYITMTTLARHLFAVAIVMLLALGACTLQHGETCYPGDYIACACDDGSTGLSMCASDDAGNVQGYAACDCSASVADAGTSDAATTEGGGGEGGLLPFLASCTSNDQCQTMLCFPFNAKGPHCSMACTKDSDCPQPAPGCSMMGVCKAP
jgi:hypothetical protein